MPTQFDGREKEWNGSSAGILLRIPLKVKILIHSKHSHVFLTCLVFPLDDDDVSTYQRTNWCGALSMFNKNRLKR